MEPVIAVLSGVAGGSLISSLSPKISVNAWISICGGMIGGGFIYWIFASLAARYDVLAFDTIDINTLFSIMLIGFTGGVLMLLPVWLFQVRRK